MSQVEVLTDRRTPEAGGPGQETWLPRKIVKPLVTRSGCEVCQKPAHATCVHRGVPARGDVARWACGALGGRAIVAGGAKLGLKHGQHIAHDPDKHSPLLNVLLTLAQWMGVESDQFADATETLTGLV